MAVLQIRIFQKGDSCSVVKLWDRCGLTVPWNNPQRDIERKMAFQPELFLLGIFEQKVVASVMGGYEGHRGWMYYLAVDPDYRNRGFATGIVTEIERRIGELGCAKINLMVRGDNTAVHEFYRKLGYRIDDVVSLGKRLVED